MSTCVYRDLSQKQLPNYAIRDEYREGKTSVHINQSALSFKELLGLDFYIDSACEYPS